MKILFPLIISSMILLLSCEKTELTSICEVMDPAVELDWLKDKIESHTDQIGLGISYHAFSFKGDMYIVQGYCGRSFILWSSSYYTCEGKEKSFSKNELSMIESLPKTFIWQGSDCQ